MQDPLKIALLIEQTSPHTRGIAKGISLYAQTHGPWIFYMEEQDQGSKLITPPMKSLEQFDGDGIIAYTRNEELLKKILKSKLPVVNTTQTKIDANELPCVYTDDQALGALVAEHFIARGFRRFAFCASARSSLWSVRREEGFLNSLKKQGYATSIFPPPADSSRKISWKRDEKKVLDWLKSLPQPVALFSDNDNCGRIILELCRQLGIHVPEEIAVVSADNDELICEFSNPYLTSASLSKEQIGFEAAGLLEKIIRKKTEPTLPILIPPLGITTRRSSDIFAVEDKLVAEALNYIYNHAGDKIAVTDLLKETHLCRRYLELRFRKATGRSPYKEIRRAHVERARKLLAETNLPMDRIAEASGFSEEKHLYINFRKEMNLSPSQYRKKFKCIIPSGSNPLALQ